VARMCLIEDAANGPAVISALRNRVPALIAEKPDGSKEARAHAVTPLIEAGNVQLPQDLIPAPAGYRELAVSALIEEAAAFPNGAFDDQVDAMTQALRRLAAASRSRPRSGKHNPIVTLDQQL
jgi:predicted phage terminase large subunit-like protein